MRLSSSAFGAQSRFVLSSRWLWPVIVGLFVAIFTLDCLTETAPVQHLYYIPIILSAWGFSWRGAVVSGLATIALYHLASPSLLVGRYVEFDLVQSILFVAVGCVTARLVNDARMLRQLATTDDLTGLHNLRSFEASLLGLIQAARQASASVSLLSMDVDRLKSINDEHGHLAGAETVRTVGHIIASNLPPGAVACRYGGDEFAIVVSCPLFQAECIAANLCRSVSCAEARFAGRVWPAGTLSISIGVACHSFGDHDLTFGEAGELLFRDADRALYRAKAAGRNRIASTQVELVPREAT